MIQELIFTSAPRGLQIGKSGFCTVASTPGMAENVARLLESLSGYRHIFPAGSIGPQTNPVVYSHVITRVGGRPLHIVSRVADAGLDYSGRSNKIAHHLALDANRLPAGGPIGILQTPSLFLETWNRAPERLPPKTLGNGENSPRPCKAWEQVTGDAGWGASLAEAYLNRRPAYLIVAPHTPALDLIAESLALLPSGEQWRVTFSSYFTNLPANVECHWRCVQSGSTEEAVARRNPQNLVLDCTRRLGKCDGVHADAGRRGELVRGSIPTAAIMLPSLTEETMPANGDLLMARPIEHPDSAEYRLAAETSGTGGSACPPKISQRHFWRRSKPDIQDDDQQESNLATIIAIASVSIASVALIIGAVLVLRPEWKTEPVAANTSQQVPTGSGAEVDIADTSQPKQPLSVPEDSPGVVVTEIDDDDKEESTPNENPTDVGSSKNDPREMPRERSTGKNKKESDSSTTTSRTPPPSTTPQLVVQTADDSLDESVLSRKLASSFVRRHNKLELLLICYKADKTLETRIIKKNKRFEFPPSSTGSSAILRFDEDMQNDYKRFATIKNAKEEQPFTSLLKKKVLGYDAPHDSLIWFRFRENQDFIVPIQPVSAVTELATAESDDDVPVFGANAFWNSRDNLVWQMIIPDELNHTIESKYKLTTKFEPDQSGENVKLRITSTIDLPDSNIIEFQLLECDVTRKQAARRQTFEMKRKIREVQPLDGSLLSENFEEAKVKSNEAKVKRDEGKDKFDEAENEAANPELTPAEKDAANEKVTQAKNERDAAEMEFEAAEKQRVAIDQCIKYFNTLKKKDIAIALVGSTLMEIKKPAGSNANTANVLVPRGIVFFCFSESAKKKVDSTIASKVTEIWMKQTADLIDHLQTISK